MQLSYIYKQVYCLLIAPILELQYSYMFLLQPAAILREPQYSDIYSMVCVLLITMGSSVSGIIADMFLPYCEQLILKHMYETKTIIFYSRCVDDIVIIFNSTVTSEEYIMNLMKAIHFNL
jgi:hypothetical protein